VRVEKDGDLTRGLVDEDKFAFDRAGLDFFGVRAFRIARMAVFAAALGDASGEDVVREGRARTGDLPVAVGSAAVYDGFEVG
jgi:hypothetical protein